MKSIHYRSRKFEPNTRFWGIVQSNPKITWVFIGYLEIAWTFYTFRGCCGVGNQDAIGSNCDDLRNPTTKLPFRDFVFLFLMGGKNN